MTGPSVDSDLLKRLLMEVIEQSSEQREAFIRNAAAGDLSLQQRLLGLVAAWQRAETSLPDVPAIPPLTPSSAERLLGEREGDAIGPYVLVEKLGEGGFGAVFRARQETPVRRELALKLLKPGMDGGSVLARFEAERQALARLTHSSIARIYDAGETLSGRPYFAMELVEGPPVTVYCDRHRLTIEQRLRLFCRMCHAIQHAHQKGIIHRDLKPSNVLVMEVDGAPEPKIIDFGIAKALDEPLTDMSMLTRAPQLVGTPRYMSPEQASMDSTAVDTRSDVYSLGVLLYELLCGSPPMSDEMMKSAGWSDLARVLREGDFERPSARLRNEQSRREFIADARGTDSWHLQRLLASDLDWIAMKAIDPDPGRRYQTAFAFARDIDRYLVNEAVEARPPSTTYLARKFVRRHRVPVAAALVVTVALIGGLFAALWGMHRASIERDLAAEALAEANAATDFLSGVFSAIDPGEQGLDVKVADLLDGAVERLDKEFKGRPETRARLHHVLGNAYWYLGDWSRAETQIRQAFDLRRTALGLDDPETLRALGNLASLRYEQGDTASALAISRGMVERFEKAFGEEHPQTMGVMGNYALMLGASGDVEGALEMQQRVFDLQERVMGPEHPQTVGALHNLAQTLQNVGRLDEAERMYEDALARGERALGAEAPETVLARESLALFYHRARRSEQARPILERVLEDCRNIYGEEHPKTITALYNLGANALQAADFDRAEHYFLDVLQKTPQSIPPHHPAITSAVSMLLSVHTPDRWTDASPELVRQVVATARLAAEKPQRLSANQQNDVAMALATVQPESQRDLPLALQMARSACERAEREGDAFLYGYLDTLAMVLSLSGKHEEAVTTAERALSLTPEDATEARAEIEANLQRFRER